MKKRFSFANLFPGGHRAESEGYDDDEKTEDQTDDETASDETDDDTQAEDNPGNDNDDTSAEGENGDGEDDNGGDDDGDGDTSARAAERARIGSILSSPHVGAHNFAQAAEIACNTDLSPKQAAGILKSGGAAKTQGNLSSAMRGRTAAAPGRGDSNRSSGKSSADLMKQRFAQKG